MLKKTATQITSYYQKDTVVKGYDDRRFQGVGGQYINQQEIAAITDLTGHLEKTDAILDLGAGRGRLTSPLKKISKDVSALERSDSMIGFLKKIIPADHILQQSIFDPLPKRKKYTLITSLRFFEHFKLSDQSKILATVVPQIEKEGFFIYASVSDHSFEGLIARFFPYGRYNYFYTDDTYRKMFKKHHLQVVQTEGRFFIPRGVFLHLKPNFLVSTVIAFDKVMTSIVPAWCSYQVYLLRKV